METRIEADVIEMMKSQMAVLKHKLESQSILNERLIRRVMHARMQWVRKVVKWHGLRHPRDMGWEEVEGFLAMLANERRVAASTHNQALSALLGDSTQFNAGPQPRHHLFFAVLPDAAVVQAANKQRQALPRSSRNFILQIMREMTRDLCSAAPVNREQTVMRRSRVDCRPVKFRQARTGGIGCC